MGKFKDLGELVKLISGVVLFFGVIYYLSGSYYDDKEKELDKKITEVCSVIRRQQPNNLDLYDDCWNTAREQFNN